MNFYRSNLDKKGNLLNEGDIVKLEVFEPKLCHRGVTMMLGRIIDLDKNSMDNKLTISLEDSYSSNLNHRFRKAKDVELITDNAEILFQKQKDSYESAFMLRKFESEI